MQRCRTWITDNCAQENLDLAFRSTFWDDLQMPPSSTPESKTTAKGRAATARNSASGDAAPETKGMLHALTVGHSTKPIAEFLEQLTGHNVNCLIDVRTVPRSRHNPQFEGEALAASLGRVGIAYMHMSGLGGFRRSLPESENSGWRNLSFRGYADYMQSAEFVSNIERLISVLSEYRVALMCAEAVPWRCHRSLIADALAVRGILVLEISGKRLVPHKLTAFAQVEGKKIIYPPLKKD